MSISIDFLILIFTLLNVGALITIGVQSFLIRKDFTHLRDYLLAKEELSQIKENTSLRKVFFKGKGFSMPRFAEDEEATCPDDAPRLPEDVEKFLYK